MKFLSEMAQMLFRRWYTIAAPGAALAAAIVSTKIAHTSASPDSLPESVPYLLIGAGTASFSAFRAIRGRDASAKVRFIFGYELLL